MRIVKIHTHLNGQEHILIHKPELWHDIVTAVESVDANSCEVDDFCSEISEQSARYSPARLIHELRSRLLDLDWRADQATNLIRDRIAVCLQFGEPGTGAYDLVAKHLASYAADVIDVGVEILPMKSLQAEMSSGIAYFEGELYNVLRHGRGTPAVPLVLIGVAS